MKTYLNRLVGFLVATVAFLPSLPAAQQPLTVEELKAASTHIVIGVVEKITSKVVKNPNGAGNTDRHFQITLKLKVIDKGKGIDKKQDLIVHAWKPERRKETFPGPQGHSNIPNKEGATLRLYLKKVDEAFRVVHPNGIVPIKVNSSKEID